MANECPATTWDFFIAHAGADADTAVALYDLLEPHCRPFVDRRTLLLGDDWDTALAIAQRSSEITVILISSKTENAYYQREEIAVAIALAREGPARHRVVPIYLDSAAAASDSVPYGLRLKNGLTLSDTIDLENVSKQLLDLLSALHRAEPTIGRQERSVDQPPATDLKYYVYASPSKIDMLFSQMPETVRGAIAKARQLETATPQLGAATIYSKIGGVTEYLERRGLVGTIDNPSAYFRGALLMRWGPYGEELIYFGAVTESCILGLGGSAKNVIGSAGPSYAHSHSATPALTGVLQKELGLADQVKQSTFMRMDPDSLTLAAVELASTQMQGPQQTIEFVARKLLCWPDDGTEYNWQGQSGRRVLLGTPLYAALVDG